MHKFPSENTRAEQRKLWTKFVRRHRADFSPTPYSVICSAHFDASCYPQCYSLDILEILKPKAIYLSPEAVSTIDAVSVESTTIYRRDKRKVSKLCLSMHD